MPTVASPSPLTSPVLGHVPHAFSTREGGVSPGVFGTLNFGNPGDLPAEERDPQVNIRENWRRLLVTIGAPERELVEVHQVHGSVVHVVHRGGPAHGGSRDTKADALVTDDPARVIAVRVADCAPVLIASRDGRVVAAVHAGWRGVVAGIAPAAVRAMRDLAPRSCDGGLAAAIGPCIGAGAFEVGPEVVAEFERAFGRASPHVRPGGCGKWLIDLKGALREQLIGAGVDDSCIGVLPHCTYSDPARFFSHRRATHERAITGRLAAVIGPRD